MTWKRLVGALVLMLALAAVAVVALNLRDEGPGLDRGVAHGTTDVATRLLPDPIARGEYLSRAGDCLGCHTVRGGAAYAGGRGVETPFGTVYAPNLTPDPQTGIGAWSADDFWRALHNGRSRDGRLLYPAFPYLNYTKVVRADADALYAYLRSLPAVVQPNRPHALGFPFNLQASLAVWRALYFKPGTFAADPSRTPEWNRGAYLVEGLGHCNACHSSRNALGASSDPLDLAGGLIPVQNWYAPSLTAADEAGVADWDARDVIELLRSGVSPRGSVTGPMSEVVRNGTQYLSEADLAAIASFLMTLPASRSAVRPPAAMATSATAPASASASRSASASAPPVGTPAHGATLYEDRCAQCHGSDGAGVPGAYPALAGNRAVTMRSPANLVHIVLQGGFAPSTAGNPRPFGMPPFATTLGNDDVADVLSYIRSAWGNRGAPVSALDVNRFRPDAKP